MEMSLFGVDLEIDFTANEIRYPTGNRSCPILVAGNTFDMTLILDSCTFELFADGGKSCMYGLIPKSKIDSASPSIFLKAHSEKYQLDLIEIHSLKSIWE